MQYYQQCLALGSKSGLSLVSQAPAAELDRLYHRLWQEVFRFERRFSRFLPGSELSLFNRQAGTMQSVSPEFQQLLLAASRLAEQTGGLYNPFMLPAVQAAGYRQSRVPGHEQDAVDDYTQRSVTTIERLEIGDGWARIPYGTALDLGGCGKGYLADSLQQLLPDNVTGYWLSFGGDMAVGGRDDDGRPWKVNIESAEHPELSIGSLSLSQPGGVATSATTVHQGHHRGQPWHHLIDPRSARPAKTDVRQATVCAASALQADVLASCAVILGGRQGLGFLRAQGVRAAVLQCWTAEAGSRLLQTGNGIMLGTDHA